MEGGREGGREEWMKEGDRGSENKSCDIIPHNLHKKEQSTSLPGSVQEAVADVLVIPETVGVAGTCGGPTGRVVTSTMAGALSRSLSSSMSSMLNAVMDNLRHNRHFSTLEPL